MRIGFSGAHRTGKSTLARAVAKQLHLPFLTSAASRVAADYGFDMGRDNRLTTNGMAMQECQLRAMLEQIAAAGASYVCDRTPIDAAAYLLGDATAFAGDEAYRERAVEYVERAIALTAKHFDVVILLPPAITFEPMDGKPPFNVAYQEHHHMLCRGMLFDEALGHMQDRIGTILRENTDRDGRLNAALDFVDLHFPRAVAA